MGAKMYVNFDGKFEFNVAYQMLIKELQPFLKADGGEDGMMNSFKSYKVTTVSVSSSNLLG